MNRKDLIAKISKIAPKIIEIVFSSDMGYEFTAIHSEGIIFAEPGMLINVSGGQLPTDEHLINFINKKYFKITPWDEINDEVLAGIHNGNS
jgi:hypothetical protein